MSFIGINGVVSTGNSTTDDISASGAFIGEWEAVEVYSSISIIAQASGRVSSAFAEFSMDTTRVDRSIQLSDETRPVEQAGTTVLIPLARFFRIRAVNDNPVAISGVRLQTIFHKTAKIAQHTARLNDPLNDFSSALNTRSVLTNSSGINVNVDARRALSVDTPKASKTAFGESLVGELEHEVALNFVYSINPETVIVHENQAGTVVSANSLANISTGASANSSAQLFSKDIIRYQPGMGVRARFTALFTAGAAGSTQIIGMGNSCNGFFFGYNGTSFGTLHRKGGSVEVRTLTITTPSSTAENITITLDGDSTGDTVVVTDSSNGTVTANEIAAHDYSDVGTGWTARAQGSGVIFTSRDSEPHAGSYSLTDATDAAGTFAQDIAGVSPVDAWTPKESWNGDNIFNGLGVSDTILDPALGNVFQINFQWLGFGNICFFIEDPIDGEFHLVHTIKYPNNNITPSLDNPSLPIFCEAKNTSNTSDIVIKSSSWGGFVDGKIKLLGPRRGVSTTLVLGITSAETPILTIKNRHVFQGRLNQVHAKILLASVAAEHIQPVQIIFYSNPTLVDAVFNDVDTETSVLSLDTTATSFSGGTQLFTISLAKTGSQILSLSQDLLDGTLRPGEHITATLKPIFGNNAAATVSLHIVELF